MDKRVSKEKEEFWRLVIEEHRNSGLSGRAFCHREGLSESLFYGWRTKLQKRDAVTSQTTEGNGQQLLPVQIIDSGKQQLPSQLTAGSSTAYAPARTVEVVTPSGFLVRVDESIDPSRLTKLMDGIVGLDKRVASSC